MSHALRRETLGKFITRRKRIPLPDLSHLRPANDDLSRLCIKFQMVKKHTLMDLSSASCLALVVNYVLSREKKMQMELLACKSLACKVMQVTWNKQ